MSNPLIIYRSSGTELRLRHPVDKHETLGSAFRSVGVAFRDVLQRNTHSAWAALFNVARQVGRIRAT